MPDVLHVVPHDDIVGHDIDATEADCVCGPRTEPVERDDGSMGWLIVHHSLDGREQEKSGDA